MRVTVYREEGGGAAKCPITKEKESKQMSGEDCWIDNATQVHTVMAVRG
jgi:hypothetical protein